MKLIIVDRDGVINVDSEQYIKTPDEWQAIPGSLEAIAQLTKREYRVVVATNQSGIRRGLFDEEQLARIHQKMQLELQRHGGTIDRIFYCPHLPDDQCTCRKPKPGLLFQIAATYPIKLTNTFFIGDSLSDLEAAIAAGCQPVLVLTGKGQQTLRHARHIPNLNVFSDLAAAVKFILADKL